MLSFVISVKKITFKGSTETVCLIHHTLCIQPSLEKCIVNSYLCMVTCFAIAPPFTVVLCHKALIALLWDFTTASFTNRKGDLATVNDCNMSNSSFSPPTLSLVISLKAKKYIHVYIGEISANHSKQHDLHKKYIGSFKSNRYVMAALCQSLRKVSTCEGSHSSINWVLHPWPEEGWDGQCSVSAPSLCSSREFWAPSSAAGHSVPHSCGCCGATGYLPAKPKASLLVCKWASKKIYGVLGTSLEQPAHLTAGITPYCQVEKNK